MTRISLKKLVLSRMLASRSRLLSACSEGGRCSYYEIPAVPLVARNWSSRLPDELAELGTELEATRQPCCELRDVRLVGANAVALLPEGRFLIESAGSSLDSLALSVSKRDICRGLRPRNTPPPTTSVVVVNLAPLWSHGYFHWLVEVLPQLFYFAEQFDEEYGAGHFKVIISHRGGHFVRESLRILGVPSDRISEWTPGSYDSVSRYALLPFPRTERWISARPYDWLRRTMLRELGLDPSVAPTKMYYISRQGARARAVGNEDALLPILDRYGIEVLRSEEYSFAAQVEMFSQARLIVGPHGAGLANMIWGGSMSVIELFGDTRVHCYYTLANALGHRYECVQGREEHGLISVDPSRLEAALERHLRHEDRGGSPGRGVH